MGLLAAASAGPFLAICALLVVSGVEKLRHPEPARAALLAAGLRLPAAAAMGIGAVELTVGIAGAAVGRFGAGLYLAPGTRAGGNARLGDMPGTQYH